MFSQTSDAIPILGLPSARSCASGRPPRQPHRRRDERQGHLREPLPREAQGREVAPQEEGLPRQGGPAAGLAGEARPPRRPRPRARGVRGRRRGRHRRGLWDGEEDLRRRRRLARGRHGDLQRPQRLARAPELLLRRERGLLHRLRRAHGGERPEPPLLRGHDPARRDGRVGRAVVLRAVVVRPPGDAGGDGQVPVPEPHRRLHGQAEAGPRRRRRRGRLGPVLRRLVGRHRQVPQLDGDGVLRALGLGCLEGWEPPGSAGLE